MLDLLAITFGYKATLDEALLYAGIGFLVVFLGIGFLVLVVWAIGAAISKVTAAQKKVKTVEKAEAVPQVSLPSEDLDEQTVAVITAAIAAYYQKQQIPCEFVIKKIRRTNKA